MENFLLLKENKFPVIACLTASLAGYLYFGYVLHREDFLSLVTVYSVLFTAYIFLVTRVEDSGKFLFGAAILFRLSFLFSVPALSDDFYRFIWDGKRSAMGINPYSITPNAFIQTTGNADSYLLYLYANMNSRDYFTVYPPVSQFVFALAAFLFPTNLLSAIIVLRVVCIVADIGNIFLIRKMLRRLQIPTGNVWWYALNPLVIIELSGNLHFEGVMIFFLLLSILFLFRNEGNGDDKQEKFSFQKLSIAGISYALAICSKLIPLLFLPFLIKRLKWKGSFVFFSVTFLGVALLFLPFINQALISNIGSSLNLYFQKFEFNASIYYLIRWIGFWWRGYDIINAAGPWLGITVLVLIIVLAITEKRNTARNFFLMMQWSLLIYLLLATTIHPWYIIPLLMGCVFTGYHFPVVWSLAVILSYATYQTKSYHENLWLTAFEYAVLIAALLIDVGRQRRMVIMRT